MAQRIVVYVSVESFPKKQIKFLVHFVALLIDKWELQGNLWGCTWNIEQVLLQGGNLFYRIDALVLT